MKVMTTHDARANFASVVKGVIENQDEVVILRDGGKAAVIIDLDTWNAMKQTLHALGDRTGGSNLTESAEAAEDGEFVELQAPELKAP